MRSLKQQGLLVPFLWQVNSTPWFHYVCSVSSLKWRQKQKRSREETKSSHADLSCIQEWSDSKIKRMRRLPWKFQFLRARITGNDFTGGRLHASDQDRIDAAQLTDWWLRNNEKAGWLVFLNVITWRWNSSLSVQRQTRNWQVTVIALRCFFVHSFLLFLLLCCFIFSVDLRTFFCSACFDVSRFLIFLVSLPRSCLPCLSVWSSGCCPSVTSFFCLFVCLFVVVVVVHVSFRSFLLLFLSAWCWIDAFFFDASLRQNGNEKREKKCENDCHNNGIDEIKTNENCQSGVPRVLCASPLLAVLLCLHLPAMKQHFILIVPLFSFPFSQHSRPFGREDEKDERKTRRPREDERKRRREDFSFLVQSLETKKEGSCSWLLY